MSCHAVNMHKASLHPAGSVLLLLIPASAITEDNTGWARLGLSSTYVSGENTGLAPYEQGFLKPVFCWGNGTATNSPLCFVMPTADPNGLHKGGIGSQGVQ